MSRSVDCVYINLERAVARRRALESSFESCIGSRWTLYRFQALDADYVRRKSIPGNLGDAAKACFLSHRRVIEASLASSESLLVLEDDAILGSHTAQQIEQLVRGSDAPPWDLAFTDFIVPDLAWMAGLFKLRQRLAGQIKLLDLSALPFAGSTAYVVNGRSKARVAGLLAAAARLDVPYDLYLRDLVYKKQLVACGFFPFITSLSAVAHQSDIQPEGKTATLVWDAFRKLSWADRDLEQQKPLLRTIANAFCDEESAAFGTLFAAMTSPAFCQTAVR
ncbi:MAG TPA: glycosyltransferase family 25 protein [Steroidobacteraceae bacterium]|jgi:GR25 family glycosyltransferase involved in LPS biosynthesis|nr:glycosyltransferase family 25 protein [Steroidobacteraceae bacterium]